MTKQEFKSRWESGDDGGGITWEEVAEVAEKWGLCRTPQIRPMNSILSLVLDAAGCENDLDDRHGEDE